MNRCIRCGIPENKALLFDAISKKGIVKICRKCSFEENVLLIKKPKFSEFPEEEIRQDKKKSVYERLSHLSGIKDKELIVKNKDLLRQEESLKNISTENFKLQKINENAKNELVDSFHWRIMRARRLKHLTQEQFAEAIEEQEISIKEIEQGIVRENDFVLIRKIENYLGIKIIKKEIAVQEKPTEFNFDKTTTMVLKISDLKKMKQEKEDEILTHSQERQNETFERDSEENFSLNEEIENNTDEFKSEENKKELSDDEMNDLIFGKK